MAFIRRATAGTAVACLTTLVTACGGSGSGGTASNSTPMPTSATTASTAAPAPTGSSPPSPSAPAPRGGAGSGSGVPPCATRDLQVTTGPTQGAAGSVYVILLFTNTSGSTCTLYGYPGVALANGSPVKQVGLPAERTASHPVRVVTLHSGGVANAVLRIVEAGNFPAPDCDMVRTSWLQVIPPNQYTPAYLRYSSYACAKPVRILSVAPVQPGADTGF
jgi:hypothetical protein